MKKSVVLVGVLALIGVAGYATYSEWQQGSEKAARAYLAAEFAKWIAGQDSEAETMSFRSQGLLAPLAYEIRSLVPDKPDFMAFDQDGDLPADWKSWPAYRCNVYIEWKSQAGTPVEKATTYTLTWNASEKKWYITERFL